MTNLTESPIYEEGIFQLEKSTPVLGGAPVIDGGVPSAGHANAQAQQLANRTFNLNQRLTTAESDIGTLQTQATDIDGRVDIIEGEISSGGSAAALRADLARQDSTDLGANLIGWDSGPLTSQLNLSKKFASYAQMRAYTGSATAFEIVTPGIGGEFYIDTSDTTTPDDGGVTFVDGLGRRIKRRFDGKVFPQWWGANGNDAASDDTFAIDPALTYCSTNSKCLWFKKGTYRYTGTGHPFTGTRLFIEGEGAEATVIILGATSRLIDTATAKVVLEIQGLQFANGLGAFRSTFAGVDVSYQKLIHKNVFIGYTACAIDVNASDCPYWKIQFNSFRAANSVSTIGIALNRWADVSLIKGNAFLTNRIHLKLRTAGQCVAVESNDFIQFETGNGTPRISIWLVPGATNEGHGCTISGGNKFGLENLQATDYRVVYAPELSGASNGLAMPDLSADTAEYVYGATISENVFCGSDLSSPSIVYTTTPYIRGLVVSDNQLQYNTPKFLLEFRTTPTVNEGTASLNLLSDNINLSAGLATPPLSPSNGNYTATFVDTSYENAGRGTLFYPHTSGANDKTGYVELFNSRISGMPLAGGSTSQGTTTDATGESDAYALTFPNFSAVNCVLPTGSIVAGAVSWIEFDLKANGTTPLTLITARIAHSSGANSFQRIAVPGIGWTRFRFPFKFRSNTLAPTFQLINLSGATGTLAVGRIRLYHAREPVVFGRISFEQLNLSSLPTSSSGLPAGSLWVDTAAGNVIKRM